MFTNQEIHDEFHNNFNGYIECGIKDGMPNTDCAYGGAVKVSGELTLRQVEMLHQLLSLKAEICSR